MFRAILMSALLGCVVACGSAFPGNSGDLDPANGDTTGVVPDLSGIECFGNPDDGMYCVPKGSLWNCVDTPSGVHCSRDGVGTPDGQSDWSCERNIEFLICNKDTPGPIDGGDAWSCTSDEAGTSCTLTGGTDVPDGAGWTCNADPEIGLSCDGPGDDGTGSSSTPSDNGSSVCFYPEGGGTDPTLDGSSALATIVTTEETYDGTPALHVKISFDKAFVDNTYGVNSTDGYPHDQHSFTQLVRSDHVELYLRDGNGDLVLDAAIDYLSASPDAPSGYASLGVDGGDGHLIRGSRSDVLDATSSLDRNFNDYGYVLTEDSPATDASYTPNAHYPNWNFTVEYEIWVRRDAFGSAGPGDITIEEVHASPSRVGSDTVAVTPGPCQ